ncbi:MAG: hypothetical protein AVDCRST_MAG53-2211 [uncultured Solirubrobacteraceae bacterium]|uniref:Uncharacterized protein n=1 Tax=uncultured Solirubrobacteraceae bacterium TaxID=1162706 RepID=A0A6J4SF75_9ACTN|nr:MAG: hypothetical protein AVDCRST_MAG53-2211 [uncultured Solirubrobacteraceae bacterium]
MTVPALAETHTFWAVALGIGAVVLAVVVVLMSLLLSFLKDIADSVTRLLEVGAEVGANTAKIKQLADTGPVLEMIKAEALIHDGYLESQLR